MRGALVLVVTNRLAGYGHDAAARYGDQVQPDEVFANCAEPVSPASAWLQIGR